MKQKGNLREKKLEPELKKQKFRTKKRQTKHLINKFMNQQKSFMDNFFLKKNIQQKKKEKLRQPSQRFQLTSIADEQKRRRSSSGHAGLRRHRRRPRLGHASPPAVWSSRRWPATLLARRYSSAPPLRACCRLPARRWSQEKNPAKRRERKRKGEKKRRRLDTG